MSTREALAKIKGALDSYGSRLMMVGETSEWDTLGAARDAVRALEGMGEPVGYGIRMHGRLSGRLFWDKEEALRIVQPTHAVVPLYAGPEKP